MVLTYSETFKRQLKRLSRKYRRIRSDIEPILKRLAAGEVLGDQIPGARHPLYKVRAPNRDAQREPGTALTFQHSLAAELLRILLSSPALAAVYHLAAACLAESHRLA